MEFVCLFLSKIIEYFRHHVCMLTEKAMAPHSSTLAWKIPWMEEPGRLPSMGSHRVGHDWSDLAAAVHVKLLQSCLTLREPMDWSLSDSPVHEILQARTLEQVAMPSSRGSSPLRERIRVSYVSGDWQVGSLPLVLFWWKRYLELIQIGKMQPRIESQFPCCSLCLSQQDVVHYPAIPAPALRMQRQGDSILEWNTKSILKLRGKLHLLTLDFFSPYTYRLVISFIIYEHFSFIF